MGEGPSRREVFHGKLIRVEVLDEPYREIVRHPGACAVVAVTPNGGVLLVRQMREPVDEILLEIPAGVLDVQGESASDCAARELLEETGHRATRVERLGTVLTSPGFTDERIELFLADASSEPEGGGEDGVDIVRMPLADAVAAVRDGRITDAKTIAALLLASDRPSVPGGPVERGVGEG